ncbi:MAG TPA: hypothetical protein PKJ33_02985 [Alphaproteobacteria bacterium]|nr:hypothetical protein [Alphaproteobacteria bacterium]
MRVLFIIPIFILAACVNNTGTYNPQAARATSIEILNQTIASNQTQAQIDTNITQQEQEYCDGVEDGFFQVCPRAYNRPYCGGILNKGKTYRDGLREGREKARYGCY